jgi:hypothetical protein
LGNSKPALLTIRQVQETKKPCDLQGFSEAADGTRTHDLLHGKQTRRHLVPFIRGGGVADSCGLPVITRGSGNQLVTGAARLSDLVSMKKGRLSRTGLDSAVVRALAFAEAASNAYLPIASSREDQASRERLRVKSQDVV